MGFRLIGVPRFHGHGTHGHAPHGLGLGGWMILLAATILATPFVIWAAARAAMFLGLWG